MKNLIQQIQDRLSDVVGLNYIDEDWGQLDQYAPHHPVKYPCALIDISTIQFTDIGVDYRLKPPQRQQGQCTVSITVGNLKLTNTGNKAPETQKKQARYIWELVEEIHKQLHGWSPALHRGELTRTSISRTERDDGVQLYRINYQLLLINC